MVDVAFVARAVQHLFTVSSSDGEVRVLPVALVPGEDAVGRFEVVLPSGRHKRVVVKSCPLRERVALSLLDGMDVVPRVFVQDTSMDEIMDVAMVDPGQEVLGSDERACRLAAGALSEVHSRFLGHDQQLSAVPPLTEEYLRNVVTESWQVAWLTSLQDTRFLAAFSAWLRPVEQSAATLPDDLMIFADRLQLNTLVHTDIFPGQLIEQDGRALLINWGQARRAPLFLDLGDTFDTVDAGWAYRDALADQGVFIDNDLFLRGHRLGRRFAGIRYLRPWLTGWLENPHERNRRGLQRMLTLATGQAT